MRDLGDFVDMLVKAAVFGRLGKRTIFQTSLGPAITQFGRCFSDQQRLIDWLTRYNQFLYRDAKHDFQLPSGRREHRFTSREAVLTVFITMELADAVCALSPTAARVRRDEPI